MFGGWMGWRACLTWGSEVQAATTQAQLVRVKERVVGYQDQFKCQGNAGWAPHADGVGYGVEAGVREAPSTTLPSACFQPHEAGLWN